MIIGNFYQDFKDFINSNKFLKYFVIITLFLNLINWLLVYLKFARFFAGQSETVILHYNIYFGIDKIGNWAEVFYLPLYGLVFLLLNILIGFLLHKKDTFIYFSLVSTAFLSILLLNIATLYIVMVN